MVGVLEAVAPVEREGVGVWLGVGVVVGVIELVDPTDIDGVGVRDGVEDGDKEGAAVRLKDIELRVYGVTPIPGLWTEI
jgi:hypothetical protein